MSSFIRFAGTATLSALLASAAMAQSPMSASAPPPPVVRPAAPVAPPRAAADMQAVLDAHAKLGAKPIETLTPAQARLQPTPADAVAAVLRAKGQPSAPDASVTTAEMAYGKHPLQMARIYTPAGRPAGPRPLIVYYHGGGWVIADLDTYDATPRMLAKELGAVVVSVEYRHAPEVKFPAQHEDAVTAYRWALAQARGWGADPARVALAGESAGGNLALATAIVARDRKLTAPRAVLAVYPIANSSPTLASRTDSGAAKPLNTPMLAWFGHYYARSKADQRDPRINLVAANLRGLPPVTIVNARIDPLRSDGETLAVALRKAGTAVEQRTFEGVTHEFFGMGAVVGGAREAAAYAAERLRTALN